MFDRFTLPFEAKPTAIFKGGGVKLALASGRIKVFVPVEHRTAGGAAAFLGNPKSARVAEVQETRRGRGNAAAIFHLIKKTLGDSIVGINAAVAKERPMRTRFVDLREINLRDEGFRLIDRSMGNDFAGRCADEALPPKFNAVAT